MFFFFYSASELVFLEPKPKGFFFFFLGMFRVGWERNLSGSEASYTDGSSYVSKLFNTTFISDRFGEVQSCKELCNLNGGFFSATREFEGPDQFQPCCSWVDPSYFSRCGGWELHSPAKVVSLLCLIKENKWILAN